MNRAQFLSDLNRTCSRDDLQWFDSGQGFFLADKPGWSEAHTRELERTNEAERQRFNHRLRNPITQGGE